MAHMHLFLKDRGFVEGVITSYEILFTVTDLGLEDYGKNHSLNFFFFNGIKILIMKKICNKIYVLI